LDIIQLLPDHVANQIAAGEVIQRPASAVKEMLENALDAGGTEIKIYIKDAGKTLLQVVDNGCGMSETDVRMCFERHATSKIKNADDLFAIQTMGFRGEAMASIAAIAHVEVNTKLTDNELGNHLIIEGSEIKRHDDCATTNGTSIKVKNLFYNVPARRNFLKSDAVEMRHITEEFTRVALAKPEIKMQLFHNNNELFHLSKGNFRQRIVNIIGGKKNETLVPIEEETSVVNIDGFIGKPEAAKRTRGEQYFFVNGRFIKNHYLHHAVSKAFEDLSPSNYFPSYFINLQIDPKLIDINIHPTKTEIKFEDEKSIYAILRSAVKRSLGQYNIAPTLDFNTEPSLVIPTGNSDRLVKEPKIRVDTNYNPFDTDTKEAISQSHKIYQNNFREEVQKEITLDSNFESAYYFQIEGTYISSQTENGLIIVHQQRAHQRILYEYFKQNKNVKISSQKLLFPETISLSKKDVSEIEDIKTELNNVGFEIDIKEDCVEIHAVPQQCENENLQKLFDEILKEQEVENSDLKENFSSKLCKTLSNSFSIKSGKRLTQEEMRLLIVELLKCDTPSISPFGLNIYFNIKTEEINKKFNK